MRNLIAAIVVTYNRLDFLKELITSLKEQTKKIDKIIVVNNNSNDGTKEWLGIQEELFVINQVNLGGAGGFYTGIKSAFEQGFVWLWIMDDDVAPKINCLEELFKNCNQKKVIAPLRLQPDGKPFCNDVIKYDLTNPIKSFWKEIISVDNLNQDLIDVEGLTFEGPFFHRELVEAIGLPERKFFIYADDTEYCLRAIRAGFKLQIVNEAILNRKLDYISPIQMEFSWKSYYIIRNIIALNRMHGNTAVSLLRPFGYLIKWLGRCKKFSDIKITIKAFFDGYFYKPDSSSLNNFKARPTTSSML